MAPMSVSPKKRPSRTPARPTRTGGGAATAPPLKKRKYVPGGPGGGGRYIDSDGNEIPAVLGMAAEQREPRTAPRPRGRPPKDPNRRRQILSPAIPSPMTTSNRPRREIPRPPQRQYTSAEAAAAAQSEGYKPREERGWEEFHKDLDIDTDLPIFSATYVDGSARPPLLFGASSTSSLPTATQNGHNHDSSHQSSLPVTPMKRRPGRPPRRPESMLSGLGSPPAPRIVPLPLHNPKERLNLNKPSFRKVDTFGEFERDESVGQNYVDKAMANVGYQESDIFVRSAKTLIRHSDWFNEDDPEIAIASKLDGSSTQLAPSSGIGRVEYDMDEQDDRWLEAYNAHRREEQADAIKPATFEIAMTLIEKCWHSLEKQIPKPSPKPPQTHRPRSSSAAAVNGEPAGDGEEQDAKCAICDDGDAENANAIVFCDGCDLAVHQECYGVPYIPEGQWLCRKCQLIGRGTPTCIFCPNVDGAFKQTGNSKWAHLLCSVWIPEVSLGNPSLMEPIMDVEKVPKSRWKLCCYICQQKMGACIQCSSRNCFTAFHVTCAKRARLYLRMKNGPRDPVMLDPGMLHAYCHKHVPTEWAREHDVISATAEAKSFYRRTMAGRQWANSQKAALSLVEPEPVTSIEDWDALALGHNPTSSNKRKKGQVQKTIWRLPSGAPIIPQAVLQSVESSMARFSIRKRKEFVAEACKYWTLKREARRGAALLKRLQLQLENFSSMEITRRDFAGMGAIGRPRLQRRIDFAGMLEGDMEQVRKLCSQVKQRELQKLEDVETLKRIIDTVYFPIPPLLWPIFEKAVGLDSKNVFATGFREIQDRLDERFYTTVSAFWSDMGAVLAPALAFEPNEALEATSQANSTDGGKTTSFISEQRDKKKLARRIAKAIQDPLQEANAKEAELGGKQAEELPDFITYWSNKAKDLQDSLSMRHGDETNATNGQVEHSELTTQPNDSGEQVADVEMQDAPETSDGNDLDTHDTAEDMALVQGPDAEHVDISMADADHTQRSEKRDSANSEAHITNGNGVPALSMSGSTNPSTTNNTGREPLTPPRSEREMAVQGLGGVPWYLHSFGPVGTTIHDEHIEEATDEAQEDDLADLSDELSEVDEALNGLVDEEMAKSVASAKKTGSAKGRKTRKRYRGFR